MIFFKIPITLLIFHEVLKTLNVLYIEDKIKSMPE